MGFVHKAIVLAFAISATAAPNSEPRQAQSSSLPVVDLGYELHQAYSYNSTGGFYNFTNIRYAAPPVGDLRFAAPAPPAVNRSVVDTGSVGRICPQADPAWLLIAETFLVDYFSTGQTNYTLADFSSETNSTAATSIPTQDPRTTEDCLFLDVVVPEAIFNNKGKGKGAPVLVWIYGGGYTAGSKSGSGNPAGLINRSENENSTGVIYVSMNYRLGAFGWSSGPTFQEDGVANAGLLDQRAALDWVKKYIHLFGGDCDQVTVFGESAGGGSIMHHITSYGGLKGPAPFQQAVLQSPGFAPVVSQNQQETTFNTFLELLNVSTLAEARRVPFAMVQLANIIQVGEAGYGGFAYGPVVDGDYVPDLPGLLLLHGQFDHSLKVMVGHNSDEGLLFTSPFIQNTSDLELDLLGTLPTIAAYPSVLSYIVNVLYPPIFDGSQAAGYTNEIARAAAVVSELTFTCNTFYLDKAFGNQTYAYEFAVYPGLHGQDIAYTYYTGDGQPQPVAASEGDGAIYPEVAIALQDYITRFAETGNPNEAGIPYFPIYGKNNTIELLNSSSIRLAIDPTANYRCDFWQKALYS